MLGGFLSAAVALTLGGLQWRASYRPLSLGPDALVVRGDTIDFGVVRPGGRLSGTGVVGAGLQADAEPGSNYRASIPYDDGATVTYAVSLHNGGSVGVTVLGMDLGAGRPYALLKPYDLRVGDTVDGGSSVTDTHPMRPFALGGGETRALIIRMRFTDCERYEPGSGQTGVAWTLRYRVLGLSRSASIELPIHLTVESPPTCPRGPPGSPRYQPTGSDPAATSATGDAVQVPPAPE